MNQFDFGCKGEKVRLGLDIKHVREASSAILAHLSSETSMAE